jgi:hypothetical protein
MRISIRTAAFSFLLSVLLWLYITLQAEYDVTAPVPLEVRVPANRSLEVPLPSEVYVTLRGSGWNLLNALSIDRTIRIAVDLPARTDDGTLTETEMRAQFRTTVPLRIVRIEPSAIDYRLDVLAEKKVPILPRVDVSAADGYVLVPPLVVVPDSAVLVGSARVVDSLSSWPTELRVHRSERRSVITLVPLERSPIVKVLPERVLVKATIDPVGELTLYDVPVSTSLRAGEELLPMHVTVLLRGGLRTIERLLERDSIPLRVGVPPALLDRDGELVAPTVEAPPGIEAIVTPRFLVRRRVSDWR